MAQLRAGPVVLLLFVATQLATDAADGQRILSRAMLPTFNASETVHFVSVTAANTNLTTFFNGNPESELDLNAQFISTAVSVYCSDNATLCNLESQQTLASLLSEPDNVYFLNGTFLDDAARSSFTFSVGYMLPTAVKMLVPSVNQSLFLPAATIFRAIETVLGRVCGGSQNVSVSYLTYGTVSGSLSRSGGCVAPSTAAPTAATSSVAPSSAATTSIPTTAAASAAPSSAATTSIPATAAASAAPSSAATTSIPTTAAASAALSSAATTSIPATAAASAAPSSAATQTQAPVAGSSAAPTTSVASLTTAPATAQPRLITVATYEILGITQDNFINDTEKILNTVVMIILLNCDVSDLAGDMGSPFNVTAPESITNGVSFSLQYVPSETFMLDCSRANTSEAGDSLADQLMSIFAETSTIAELQSVLSGGTIAARVAGTTVSGATATVAAPGDSGLSTGTIVGIAVGAAAGLLVVTILVIIILKYGSSASLSKTRSTIRIMPQSEPEPTPQVQAREAWQPSESNRHGVQVEEYTA